MGIGKRGIGILCGVLLCIMLALVLFKGKKAEESEESMVMESVEEQPVLENHTPIPDITEASLAQTSEEAPEKEETTDSGEIKAVDIPSPTPVPIPKETAPPVVTVKPVPEVTNTPAPIITTSPIPVVVETEVPKVVLAPAPTAPPTPTPEVPKTKEEHVHEFEMSVWELPTCQKSGYYNNVCKSCGVVECITQEPIPHEVEDIVVQEGNCMEDRVIRHICKMCEQQVKSDTRYTVYDKHLWNTEWVDGIEVEYCEWCGVAK